MCQSAPPISRAAQQTGRHTSVLKAAGMGAAQLQLRAEVLQLSADQGAHVFQKGFLHSLLQIRTANKEGNSVYMSTTNGAGWQYPSDWN